jgi:hypothetical protein
VVDRAGIDWTAKETMLKQSERRTREIKICKTRMSYTLAEFVLVISPPSERIVKRCVAWRSDNLSI